MQKRIEKINSYFTDFKISDGLAFITVNFSKKWQIPSNELLDEMFNVKCVNKNDGSGYYYFSPIENGLYNVFDAVDFTIEFNMNLEEKTNLLQEKINELKNLFVSLPIETLRTIKFKYNEKQTKKNKKNKSNDEIVNQVVDNTDYSETTVNNVVENINENNSLLEFAQELINVE
jgi:hypothetical protein